MEYSIKPQEIGRKENNPLPSKEDNWIIRDEMEFKCKTLKSGVIVLTVMLLLIITSAVYLFWRDGAFIGSFFVTFIPFLVVFIALLSEARTITMNEEGCLVRLLWRKKYYRWDELCVKELRQFPYASHWAEAGTVDYAVFSTKPIHIPVWMNPKTYTRRFHLFSVHFFYIDFYDDIMATTYDADMDKFLETMKKWGVEIEDKRLRKKKIKMR